MAQEPLPDGFQKAAESYRAEAEKATDAESKRKFLEAADKMQAIHDKAQHVWADTERTRRLADSVLTPEHKTKGFWIAVAIMCAIVGGFVLLRYAG